MKKVELKMEVHCERMKQKAMSTVCGLSGVTSVEVKEDKLTVTGEIDAYVIVKKLKKICYTEIITVGPVKKEEKKEEKKPEAVVMYQWPPYHHINGCVYENPNNCVIL